MISRAELEELMKDLESDRVERTISFREEKLGEAVCAFSNDLPNHKRPGYLLLGIKDNGDIAGIEIGDQDLKKNWVIFGQTATYCHSPSLLLARFFIFHREMWL